MRPLAELFKSFEDLFAGPGASAEDRRKRTYLALSLALMIPVITGFAVEDLRQGSLTEGVVVIAMAILLTGILIALAKVGELRPIFRIGGAAVLLLQFFELKIGGGGGFAFFWFYSIPVLAMTVFGRREGAAWVLAALTSAVLGFLTPYGYEYELRTVLRFLIIYVIVAIFSDALESSRSRYYSELLEEKSSLEKTLKKVRTLRGLLPICARCKKVRDDKGYWQQIEHFVDQHSETEFSHGLCPKCAARLYPELLDEPGH